VNLSWGVGLVGGVLICCGLSCSSDKRSESVAETHQALAATDRILSFEQVSTDWVASNGAVASSNVHVDGAHSAAFTVTGANAQLVSAKISSLGPIASTATLELELPSNLSGQSWQGQLALIVDAPSVNVHAQYFGPDQFQNTPVGVFQHVQFQLSSAVVSALSSATYNDLQLTLVFGMSANTQPILVDKLTFAAAAQADGGVAGATGTGTTSNSAGGSGAAAGASASSTGGAPTTGGAPPGTGGASTGSDTAAAGASSAGASGTSGPCIFTGPSGGGTSTNVDFSIKLPHGVPREAIGVATTGGYLTLDDGVRVITDAGGFASVSSVAATNRTNLGVGAEVEDVYTESTGIDLRNNAHVHGNLKTAADFTEQAGAVVDGAVSKNASLQPLDTIDWSVSFATVNRGSCDLQPDNTQVLDPASYGDMSVKSRSHLQLRSGTYYFNSLSLEPQAELDIDNTAGPVFIYVLTTFSFSGTVVEADTSHMNFLFGVAGTGTIAIQTAFRGILVAPAAGVSLATQTAVGHVGAFFANAFIAHQATNLHQEPFSPAQFCDPAAACSSFCPCPPGKACTTDSQCQTGLGCSGGQCACAPNCAGKTCGSDPSDGCGSFCPGLCAGGQPGCATDADCAFGSVCGIGMGPRFGLASGTNACWPAACRAQDPTQPNCGVDPQQCGVCPACIPQCATGSTGPDGCGGSCGACPDGESRLPNGQCAPLALANVFSNESSSNFPIPLQAASTDQAGTIPGSFAVTDRGTASYSIPIEVPPGRLGMQPSLSLNYASTKNNGMLGMGWSLGGLSTITRCPAIVDRDDFAGKGFPRPITYNADDWLCLDGHALIVTPGHTYGSDGAEYRTEIDTFAKIVSNGGAVGAPNSFTVSTKDGRILTYGATADSSVYAGFNESIKRIWALNQVTDRSGNSMSIAYKSHVVAGIESIFNTDIPGGQPDDTGELVPAQISYGASQNSAFSDSRFVQFSYETRPDPRDGFVSGVEAVSTQRLTQIDTFVGSDPIRTYKLGYKNGFSDGNSIVSISDCGYDGSTQRCLPATTFQYNVLEPQTQVLAPLQGPGTYAPDEFIQPIAMDADGDGRDDILTPSNSGVPTSWFLSQPGLGTASATVFSARPGCLDSSSVMDVNRDGKDDLISLCGLEQINTFDRSIEQPPTGDAFAYISTGSGFEARKLGFAFTGELKFADVNGDGLRDIVVCQDVVGPDVPGADARKPEALSIKDILINTGDPAFLESIFLDSGATPLSTAAFDPPPVNGPLGPGLCRNLVALDVNGDGREELVQLSDPNGIPSSSTENNDSGDTGPRISVYDTVSQTWTVFGPSLASHALMPDNQPIFRFADVNGDGLKDIAYGYPKSGSMNLAINTGTEFVSQPVPSNIFSVTDLQTSVVLDFDGDGRDDLVSSGAYLHLGEQRVALANPIVSNFWTTVGDVDGDGSLDLIPNNLTNPISLSGHAARAGFLERVTDGNGKRIDITYDAGRLGSTASGNTYAVSDCASDSKTTCLRRVAPLVSAHAESQVSLITTQSSDGPFDLPVLTPGPSYSYQYGGARIGLRGRGWLGFGNRTVTLDTLWKTTLTYLNTDFFFAGLVSNSERDYLASTPANALVNATGRSESTGYTWTKEPGDFQSFPFVTFEEQRIIEGNAHDVALTFSDTTRAPDTYGNTRSETIQTPINTTTIIRDVANDPSQWLLGLVQTEEVSSVRAGTATVTRQQGFSYYPSTKLLNTVSRVSGDAAAELTTTYGRDSFGNVSLVCSQDGAGDPARCSNVVAFDDQSIFASLVADPEGLLTTLQFSAADGRLLWKQDANGIVSEFEPDAFGRIKHVVTPTRDSTFTYFNVQNPDVFFANGPRGAINAEKSALGVRETSVERGASWRSFDAFGRVVVESSAAFGGGNDVITESQYDTLGRLVSRTLPHSGGDSSQGSTLYQYDAFGRLDQETRADGETSLYIYPTRDDALGTTKNLFSSGTADDNTSAVVVIKPRTNIEARVFDADGYVSKTVQSPALNGGDPGFTSPNIAVNSYHYTGFGMITEVDSTVDGSVTARTQIAPDAFGRTLTLDDPSLGHQINTYNGFDEVVTHTDAKGQVTFSSYDEKGRPVQLSDSFGAIIAKWQYGAAAATANERGRLIGAYRQSAPGSATGNWVRYNYQSPPGAGVNRGLLESTNYGLAGNPADPDSGERFSVDLEYKSLVPWQLDVLSYPDAGGAFAVEYNYDASSGVVSSVQPVPTGAVPNPTPYWQLRQANQGFRPSDEVFGNGTETTRAYNSLAAADEAQCTPGFACIPGTLRNISTQKVSANQSSEPLQNINYNYDVNGNVATGAGTYGYDGFDRLTFDGSSADPGGVTYTIALGGNITNRTDIGTYQYNNDARPYQVTNAGDTTYQYDENGNQTDRIGSLAPGGSQHLDYDLLDMPRQITTGQPGAAFTTELEYDGFGARAIKRRLSGAVADGDTKTCSVNPASCVSEQTLDIAELYEQVSDFAAGTCDQSGSLDRQAPHACTPTERLHNFRIYASGRQVAQVQRVEHTVGTFDPDKTYYLHNDRVGSTTLLTDANGDVEEQRHYTAFGESADANFSSSGTGVLSGFTGLEHDDGLGLVNMRGRLYDSRLARFVSADPFVTEPLNPQGLNRYAYVKNRPLNLIDPTGFMYSGGYYGGGYSGGGYSGGSYESIPSPSQPSSPTIGAPSTYDPSGMTPEGGDSATNPQTSGEAPSTTPQSTDFPSGPGSQSSSPGSNGSASSGNSGIPPISAGSNPFRGPDQRLAVNTIDDEQGGIGSGGVPTAELEMAGESAGGIGALENLEAIVESVGDSIEDLVESVEKEIDELSKPKLGPRQSLVDATEGTPEAAAPEAIDPNKLNHVFGKAEHALDQFVQESGGRAQAFSRIQDAANTALRQGKLTIGPNGILPSGNAGNIIDVGGVQIRLIGGRISGDVVDIGSASRLGLP
jgi:RHS repeat-associated protein